MQTVIKIGGMHCGKCKERLEKFISSIDGVSSVNVSLEDECAYIENSIGLDIEFIKEEIEDMGFESPL